MKKQMLFTAAILQATFAWALPFDGTADKFSASQTNAPAAGLPQTSGPKNFHVVTRRCSVTVLDNGETAITGYGPESYDIWGGTMRSIDYPVETQDLLHSEYLMIYHGPRIQQLNIEYRNMPIDTEKITAQFKDAARTIEAFASASAASIRHLAFIATIEDRDDILSFFYVSEREEFAAIPLGEEPAKVEARLKMLGIPYCTADQWIIALSPDIKEIYSSEYASREEAATSLSGDDSISSVITKKPSGKWYIKRYTLKTK